MSRILLDTSALLYVEPSVRRTQGYRRGSAGRDLVSAISLWEIGLKVQRRTLVIGTTFANDVERLQQVDRLTLRAH